MKLGAVVQALGVGRVPPRVRITLGCGLLAAYVAWTVAGMRRMDIAQVWYASRALLAGQDPYALIGPGRAFEWPAALFYPLTAALTVLPLAPLPERWAGAVFVGLGAASLAWALQSRGHWPLVAFGSFSVWHAIVTAQWGLLLAGAFAVPALGGLLIAKPTIGAAVFMARPSRTALIGGGVLVVVSLVVQPDWLTSWRLALKGTSLGGGNYPYLVPALQPGGFLALLALLRWRRPEARLVAALACIPQTMLPYEGVLLFLVPIGAVECVAFFALNWAMGAWLMTSVVAPDFETRYAHYALMVTMCMYVPAALMVLRRSNEGPVPAWLEARLAPLPAWLRGRALADA
jgi:hypothetical protein